MDINTIARKLEPLMPNEVRRWMRARELAEPTMRALIEKQLITTAYNRLGDFRDRILLSLPPSKTAKGSIHFGTIIYGEPKWPFGLTPSEVMQNLAIYGRSGAGKTNVVFHILEQLASQKIPFLLLDWKRNGRELLARIEGRLDVYTPGRSVSPLPFNPFIPPPEVEWKVFVRQAVDILGDAYTLGDGARSVVQKALSRCSTAPTPRDVLRAIEEVPGNERVRNWKVSAMRALETLAFSDVANVTDLTQSDLVRTLLNQSTVIELDALDDNTKQFLIPVLCLWLFHAKLSTRVRERLSLVVVIEEAHHVLYRSERRSKETVMNKLLRQCREIGLGIIVVDQHPHLISSAAIGNTYTSVCLNLKDPADVRRAAALSQVPDVDKSCFSILRVGEGVVKLQDRWRRPFLVQFPLVHLKKGQFTDDRLRAYLRSPRRSSRVVVSTRNHDDRSLEQLTVTFLYDVFENPDDGIRQRYSRLGLATGTGDRIKSELVQRRLVREELLAIGRTRKVLLRLTKVGADELGVGTTGRDDSDDPRASPVHDFWKRHLAQRFHERGYVVTLEAPRHGGKVDALAERAYPDADGRARLERIGIEIETGKSDVIGNVKNGLRSFRKLLVAATSDVAYARIQQHLEASGLLLPNRVRIVTASDFERGLDAFLEAGDSHDVSSDRRRSDSPRENQKKQSTARRIP